MRVALLLSLVLPYAALAETAYVTDSLRLGLHEAADTSDRAFRMLESGQELEIVTRDTNYANVRLPDGMRGHVKAAYLVFEKPAKLIVAELQTAQEGLQQELDSTRAAFAAPAATIASLEELLAQKDAALTISAARVDELAAENAVYRDQYGHYKYSLPLKWVGGAMIVCLVAGFLSGLWWIDYRSRRRHGGIRIF